MSREAHVAEDQRSRTMATASRWVSREPAAGGATPAGRPAGAGLRLRLPVPLGPGGHRLTPAGHTLPGRGQYLLHPGPGFALEVLLRPEQPQDPEQWVSGTHSGSVWRRDIHTGGQE